MRRCQYDNKEEPEIPKLLSQSQVDKYYNDGFVYPIEVMSRQEAGQYLQRLEASEALQGK